MDCKFTILGRRGDFDSYRRHRQRNRLQSKCERTTIGKGSSQMHSISLTMSTKKIGHLYALGRQGNYLN